MADLTTDKITPRNVVLLSDNDIGNLIEALGHFVQHFEGEGDLGAMRRLLRRMKEQPEMFEPFESPAKMQLTERGRQALVREVMGYSVGGTMIDGGPGSDALRAALRELDAAEAHFDVSLIEGKPGPERNAAIERRSKALEVAQREAEKYGRARLTNDERDT